MPTHLAKLIVYACPVGLLAQQIETYLAKTQALYGANAAHAYMPHCTLTGFFEDERSTIPSYVELLGSVFEEYCDRIPHPPIQIRQLTFNPDWHGLALEADWLKQLVADFAGRSHSSTRKESLRLKDWLHLSLAYEFNPDYASDLCRLAKEIIDTTSQVRWELRFYEQLLDHEPRPLPETSWRCHGSWVL
ncbi:MAG: hypothetical protein AAF716_06890 [Cyanobacteria bacterium P01_D01_bin.1]